MDNFKDQDLGWNRYMKEKLEIYEIDADHDSIIKEPHVKELAEILRKVIYNR